MRLRFIGAAASSLGFGPEDWVARPAPSWSFPDIQKKTLNFKIYPNSS